MTNVGVVLKKVEVYSLTVVNAISDKLASPNAKDFEAWAKETLAAQEPAIKVPVHFRMQLKGLLAVPPPNKTK